MPLYAFISTFSKIHIVSLVEIPYEFSIRNTRSYKSEGGGRSLALFGIRSKLVVNIEYVKNGGSICETMEEFGLKNIRNEIELKYQTNKLLDIVLVSY